MLATAPLTIAATAGINVSAANVLSGKEGTRLLDRAGVRHGLRGRLLRLLQWGAYENEALAAHDEALAEGRHVIYVPVKGNNEREQVINILVTTEGATSSTSGDGTSNRSGADHPPSVLDVDPGVAETQRIQSRSMPGGVGAFSWKRIPSSRMPKQSTPPATAAGRRTHRSGL
jgi:hypothetical protein